MELNCGFMKKICLFLHLDPIVESLKKKKKKDRILYFNSPIVPLNVISCATLGMFAVVCRESSEYGFSHCSMLYFLASKSKLQLLPILALVDWNKSPTPAMNAVS